GYSVRALDGGLHTCPPKHPLCAAGGPANFELPGVTRCPSEVPMVESKRAMSGKTKNLAAVELGKLGGRAGGQARAAALTPERRGRIARQAALKRWGKRGAESALLAFGGRPHPTE